MGADSWRRTGLLTFDGNRKLKKKATFAIIKAHLESVYNRKFGYGSVVQLCVARNKQRKSAKQYKGVARVTCRRARKGFSLCYNPDQHWSAALYRGLDDLRLKDGADILNINRDDQAGGFQLDTLATHSKHATLCIAQEEPLTTKTDYVNSYPSTLQTTSYNFSGTETTAEICGGIVKAVPLHHKNPAQHAHDLDIIKNYDDVKPAFFQVNGNRKSKVCVGVDGGHDEGPAHLEVQFWWTYYHLRTSSQTLILTTRESGSSNRNRVELQNGCLAVAHTNLFIPSTLNGSCMQSTNGKVNEDKLKENLNDAIDVYISRVNKCPCADTVINLYKGTSSSNNQNRREMVKTYLKGKPDELKRLKREHPQDYQWLKNVWELKKRHVVPKLPSKYIFHLICCYQKDCIHPLCKKGKPTPEPTWYEGGPPLSYTPIPVPDTNRYV